MQLDDQQAPSFCGKHFGNGRSARCARRVREPPRIGRSGLARTHLFRGRTVQVRVRETRWRFESSHPHQRKGPAFGPFWCADVPTTGVCAGRWATVWQQSAPQTPRWVNFCMPLLTATQPNGHTDAESSLRLPSARLGANREDTLIVIDSGIGVRFATRPPNSLCRGSAETPPSGHATWHASSRRPPGSRGPVGDVQVAALHAAATNRRRSRSSPERRPASSSSGVSTVRSASSTFSRASSRVRPWLRAPGTSSTRATIQPSELRRGAGSLRATAAS